MTDDVNDLPNSLESNKSERESKSSANPFIEALQSKDLTCICLCLVIAVAAVVRFSFPFYFNPFDNLYSDMLRHYQNALQPYSMEVMNMFDSPGYQFWLGSVLRVTYTSHTAMAIYAGLLSVITPYLWYRWMLECLPERRLALLGYAIISLLPNWIRMNSYFMQETLTLPLLAVALWMSWRANRIDDGKSYLFAAIAWGAVCITKASVMPIALICWLWKFREWISTRGLSRAMSSILPVVAVMAAIYSIWPMKVYNRIGVFPLIPNSDYNRLFYESGKKAIEITYEYRDRQNGKPYHYEWRFEDPSCYMGHQLAPLSNWISARDGVYNCTFDFVKDLEPSIHMPLLKRLRFTAENIIFFFLGYTFPMDFPEDAPGNALVAIVRWIWLPITLAILYLTVRRRQVDMLTAVFLGSLLIVLLSQSYILEGRYRLPWEGVAVAALLNLVAITRKSELPDEDAQLKLTTHSA